MKQIDEVTVRRLINVLTNFVYNPHCETMISEGKHTRGFCKTCTDNYFEGQDVLGKLVGDVGDHLTLFFKDEIK